MSNVAPLLITVTLLNPTLLKSLFKGSHTCKAIIYFFVFDNHLFAINSSIFGVRLQKNNIVQTIYKKQRLGNMLMD